MLKIALEWRTLELLICNFLKNYLIKSTICRSERTAFVVFLEESKVRIPLLYIKSLKCPTEWKWSF